MPKGILFTKLYLVSEIEADKIENFPFSFQYMAQAMSNGMLREDHETISNKDPSKLLSIMMLFLSFSANVKFDKQFL